MEFHPQKNWINPMKLKLLLLTVAFLLPAICQAEDGAIISRQTFDLTQFAPLMERIADDEDGQWVFKPDFGYLDSISLEELFYESDGLKVKAYLATPKNPRNEKYPTIIYNRGGNRDFGQLNQYKMVYILARVASWGFNVVASQYRGNDGGEGQEEFGGSDVNDVLNLIPLAEALPSAQPGSIGMYGWSRGGMMTYLALMKTDKISAAVVGGALADLQLMDDSRQGEMGREVFSELMPNYELHKEELIRERSAVFNADKICPTTPILLLHGTADWRVVPEESLHMALALQQAKVPYRLVMFEGGDHGLNEFDDEVDELTRTWFDKFLKQKAPLPNLEPHGR